MSKVWSKQEVNFVKENIDISTIDAIAEAINRTPVAIATRIMKGQIKPISDDAMDKAKRIMSRTNSSRNKTVESPNKKMGRYLINRIVSDLSELEKLI